MNCQELETAAWSEDRLVPNIIWENGQFGSIVWKQDKKFGRHFGVDFGTRRDFVKLAEAFGARPGAATRRMSSPSCLNRALDARSAVGDRRADRLLDRRGAGRDRLGVAETVAT